MSFSAVQQPPADLAVDFCGIRAPNPFWLASGPPTNTIGQVRRAFQAGWGGAVWKTVTNVPVRNVTSRYGALSLGRRRVVGLNNIELISDRPLEDNLREIAEIKREFPDRAVVVSLMVESRRETWHDIVKQAEATGADGLELNFGCPHGMNERGMGSAVGQVPDYTRMIVGWVKEVARTPVLVKLTPNVTSIREIARAAREGGADAISLINTVISIMGVDPATTLPKPHVAGQVSHGGYCGPAIRPIALHMVSQVAKDPQVRLPISGIGGVGNWQDALEHMLLGAGCVQVCTAVMHHGFAIVEKMREGLLTWMQGHGHRRVMDFVGASASRVVSWSELDQQHRVVAEIDQDTCINCGLCYVACEDGCYQAISHERVPEQQWRAGRAAMTQTNASRSQRLNPDAIDGFVDVYRVRDAACVGCNMCQHVCPVQGCITMKPHR